MTNYTEFSKQSKTSWPSWLRRTTVNREIVSSILTEVVFFETIFNGTEAGAALTRKMSSEAAHRAKLSKSLELVTNDHGCFLYI